jgi:hypothetical protein
MFLARVGTNKARHRLGGAQPKAADSDAKPLPMPDLPSELVDQASLHIAAWWGGRFQAHPSAKRREKAPSHAVG